MNNRISERLALGSYYLMLDQVVNYGLGAAFWIVLAKLVSPTVIGQVMVVIALTMTVLGFSGHGAQVMISKYVAEYNALKMYSTSKKVFKLGLKIGLIISGIIALAFSLLSNQIAVSVYQDGSLAILIIIGMLAFLPSQTVVSCLYGAFQGSQKMKYTTIADIIFQVSRISIAVILVIIGLGSTGMMIAFGVGSIVAVLWGYKLVIPRLFPATYNSTESSNLRNVFRFSGLNYLSIGISTLAMQISYLVLGTHSFHSVALFGISALISGLVGGVLASIAKAIIPTTSEVWTKEKKRNLGEAINTAFRLSLMLSGFIYILFIIAPDQILALLSKDYVYASSALRMLVLSSIVTSIASVIGSILNGAGKPEKVARIGLASSAAIIASSLILVPIFAIQGAALSVLIGSVVSLSIAFYYIGKEKEIFFSYWNIIKPALAVSTAIYIGYVAFSSTMNVIFALFLSISSYLALIMVYRITTSGEMKSLLHLALKIMNLNQK